MVKIALKIWEIHTTRLRVKKRGKTTLNWYQCEDRGHCIPRDKGIESLQYIVAVKLSLHREGRMLVWYAEVWTILGESGRPFRPEPIPLSLFSCSYASFLSFPPLRLFLVWYIIFIPGLVQSSFFSHYQSNKNSQGCSVCVVSVRSVTVVDGEPV